MNIGPAEIHEKSEWLRMRRALWPDADPRELGEELDAWLAREDAVVLVARRENGSALCGFAEVGTRSVADGCDSSPVAYLEGWYVEPSVRRRGVGSALVAAAEYASEDVGDHGGGTKAIDLAGDRGSELQGPPVRAVMRGTARSHTPPAAECSGECRERRLEGYLSRYDDASVSCRP